MLCIAKRVLGRIASLVLVLFGVTVLTFAYTSLSPVDAAYALAVRRYTRPTERQVAVVRSELGMDRPLVRQYGAWAVRALHGDFGNSYNTGQPIIKELAASLMPTMFLAFLASSFSLLITIPLGILAAARKGGLFDKSVYVFGIICMSVPNYWIGFLLLLLFAVHIPLFSILGAERIRDFVLPSLALAIPSAAAEIRVFRSSLVDAYAADFVLYARSRGISERVIAGMVSRLALPPLVTIMAQTFGFMMAGGAMVEFVFSIPGLGTMLITALNARDTITINACVLVIAAIFVLVNFLADIVNAMLNPSYDKKGGCYDAEFAS